MAAMAYNLVSWVLTAWLSPRSFSGAGGTPLCRRALPSNSQYPVSLCWTGRGRAGKASPALGRKGKHLVCAKS